MNPIFCEIVLIVKRVFCSDLSLDSIPSLLFSSLHLHEVCDFSLLSFHNFYNDPLLFKPESQLFMSYFCLFPRKQMMLNI